MKKKLFYIIPLLALASCTSNDVVENTTPVYGTEEIQVVSGVIGSVESAVSRAILTGTDVPTGGLNISILRQDATAGNTLPTSFSTLDALKPAFVGDGVVTPTGMASPLAKNSVIFGTQTSIDHQYYLANGDDSRLIAWYPQTDGTNVTYVNTTGVVTFKSLNGYKDILTAVPVSGNKGTTTRVGTIELKHMLAQLQFKAYEKTDGAIEKWGKITSIEVLSVPTECTLQLSTSAIGTVTYSTTAKANITVLNSDETSVTAADMGPYDATKSTAEASAVKFGEVLVPHISTAGTSYQIKITTEHGAPQTVDLDKTITYDQGKAYLIYLTFSTIEIEPTVQITDWISGGSQDIDM
ncbi:fimbrillin family protein [Bacteroides sp.]